MLYPLKLSAALKDYIWGGRRLIDEFHKKTNLDSVAESWELAARDEGESIISNGRYKNLTIREYVKKVGEDVLGTNASRFATFPLMVKLLDANEILSVQVHPSDEEAKFLPNAEGKTELWYIIDATPDAKLLYGVKEPMTSEEFAEHIKNNTLLDKCNYVNPKKGDVMLVTPGTLHAIGAGILLIEIQQNSNTTYRAYDYDRRGKDGKPRTLHIKEAVKVAKLRPPKRSKEEKVALPKIGDATRAEIGNNEYFRAEHIKIEGNAEFFVGGETFQTFTVIGGDVKLCAYEKKLQEDENELDLTVGDTVFLPANMGKYQVFGKAEFIMSEITRINL